MIKYIPITDFKKEFISIKWIKDLLQDGTSRAKFEHGEFARLLLVDSTQFFNDDYFAESILKEQLNSDTEFNNFVNGNLRKANKRSAYLYANKNVPKRLLAIDRHNDDKSGYVFESLTDAFELHIIPDILRYVSEGGDEGYINGLFQGIDEYISPQNTFYKELYNEIKQLIDKKLSLSTLLALLCILAIFQDNIHLLFPEKYRTPWSNDGFFPFQPEIKPLSDKIEEVVQRDSIPLITNKLFEEALSGTSELGKIAAIDMCFRGGALWLIEGAKNKLLTRAINEGIKIRVIVNTTAQVKEICTHMKQPNLKYVDFEKNLQNWVELMLKHPDSIEIRIAKVPLLRRSYIIRGEKSKGWANVTYYSYGRVIEDCQRVNYRSGSHEYKLYVDEFEYIWNNASEIYSEASLMDSKPKRNDGFKELDEDNIAFIRKALENQACQSLDILSVLAYYCAIGRVKELIKVRLSDESNFVLRMILPNQTNGKNLEKWFIGFDQESMAIFKTFESWTKRYPGRFLLHYTDLPIVDRMYINKTEAKMLVEHLSIPRSTNQAIQEEYSRATTPQIYNAFEDQFERIWTEFSDSFK